MTLQLELALDVPAPGSAAAAIAAAVRRDLESLLADPYPDDELNARARESLVAGSTLLLEWLDQHPDPPAAWRAWPCDACRARPGEPCDLPNRHRVDQALRPDRDELHHLGRGLDGRWAKHLTKEAA